MIVPRLHPDIAAASAGTVQAIVADDASVDARSMDPEVRPVVAGRTPPVCARLDNANRARKLPDKVVVRSMSHIPPELTMVVQVDLAQICRTDAHQMRRAGSAVHVVRATVDYHLPPMAARPILLDGTGVRGAQVDTSVTSIGTLVHDAHVRTASALEAK
jgi:hypothetical protein